MQPTAEATGRFTQSGTGRSYPFPPRTVYVLDLLEANRSTVEGALSLVSSRLSTATAVGKTRPVETNGGFPI